jgi:hypothetical protein
VLLVTNSTALVDVPAVQRIAGTLTPTEDEMGEPCGRGDEQERGGAEHERSHRSLCSGSGGIRTRGL